MTFRVFIGCIFWTCLWSSLSAVPLKEWNSSDWDILFSAMGKVIPVSSQPAGNDFDRLKKSVQSSARGEEGATLRDHLLEVYRISSLLGFFQELNGRLDGLRKAMNAEERSFEQVRAMRENERLPVPASLLLLKQTYREQRLTPYELALVTQFYQELNPKNQLIQNMGLKKIDTETARQANEATAWPSIKIRFHGLHLPKVPFSRNLRRDFRDIYQFYKNHDSVDAFLEYWSQLVNIEAGHLKLRHLDRFEEYFLLAIRRRAFQLSGDDRLSNSVFYARKLLLGYWSNTKTGEKLDRRQLDTIPLIPNPRDLDLAAFVDHFSRVKDRRTLERFFQRGYFPGPWSETKSERLPVLLARVLETYRLAYEEEQAKGCQTLVAQLAIPIRF